MDRLTRFLLADDAEKNQSDYSEMYEETAYSLDSSHLSHFVLSSRLRKRL